MKIRCLWEAYDEMEEDSDEDDERDPDWEPPDPPGWEGGFADNH